MGMVKFSRGIGAKTLLFINELGAMGFLVFETFTMLIFKRPRWYLMFYHSYRFGVRSQPVILLTGAFVGMVFAAQMFWQLHKVRLDHGVGPVVAVAMCRELGPTICALMIAGRVGAAITAEIATMKVTEQIDALRALATHPVDYLIVPRLAAIMVCMPILTAEAMAMGIVAGFLLSSNVLGIDPYYYMENTYRFTEALDVYTGLIKAFFFGIIIVFVSCYKGLTASGGAEGVGRATTNAVVTSSITVIIFNFFITFLLNAFFPKI